MPKISVIVPIYNAESELNKSVNSILNQTEKDIEIILVDDGSKDRSFSICENYAKEDQRVKVIHQKNAGVSAARNAGLNVASGDYIGFVDSDDWIEANMYERLLAEANNSGADVIMCDVTTVYDDGTIQADTITQLSGNNILQKSNFTPSLLLEMAGSACRCIYSKHIYRDKLLQSNELQFPLGVKFSEDRIFNLYAFGYAKKVSYLKESYYNRYMNTKSAVHRFHTDYFEAYKSAADEIKNAIRRAWDDNQALQTAYLSQFISGSLMAINNYYYKTSTLKRTERIEAVKRLCDDKYLRSAIIQYGSDRHSQWILDRNYFMLIVYAKLGNWKHGR